MTRKERLDEVLEEVAPTDNTEDTGLDALAELNELKQFLLVEKNHGSAAYMQSHFFTTHDTLDECAAYNLGQEYREDWQIVFAVDLDTGSRFAAEEPEQLIFWRTPGGELIGASDYVSRESILDALREAERNDSAADAVEFVSSIVGWSAEDDEELQAEREEGK